MRCVYQALGGFALGLLTCLSVAQSPAPADPLALRVQLLSGKTGRPITAQRVVFLSPDHKFHTESKTDGEGYAAIPDIDNHDGSIEVWVEQHQPCAKNYARTFSPSDIRNTGVVSANTCSRRIHMYKQAGTLVFFLREETWLERLRH